MACSQMSLRIVAAYRPLRYFVNTKRWLPEQREASCDLLEAEQQKRHQNDTGQLEQNFILQRLALVLGFTLSMAGLGVALVVAMAGHPWVAGIVSAAVSTFSTHLARNVLLPRKKTDLNRE